MIAVHRSAHIKGNFRNSTAVAAMSRRNPAAQRSKLLELLITQTVCAGDDRLGVDTHFSQNWDATAIMPLIAQSGFGWIKDEIFWSEFEKSKGVYEVPSKVQNGSIWRSGTG